MSALIQKEILDMIPDLYASTDMIDPLCQVKLFTPDSNWTWYIIEYSKEDSSTCYGYVQGLESELESIHAVLNLRVERDIYFKPTLLSEIMN